MINIYNKLLSNKDKKILYIKHKSVFDLIIQDIFPDVIQANNLNQINYYFTFCSVIYNNFLDFRNAEYNNNLEYLKYNLPYSICFIHDDIFGVSKLEDIKIMLENNIGLSLINFNLANKDYIGYHKYGIPYHRNKVQEDSKKVLIIDSDGVIDLPTIKKEISCDILNNFDNFKDYDDCLEHLSQYKIICSTKTIDLIVASTLGCITIDLNRFDLNGLKQTINHALTQKTPTPQTETFLKLNVHLLKKEIFNANNCKAFL